MTTALDILRPKFSDLIDAIVTCPKCGTVSRGHPDSYYPWWWHKCPPAQTYEPYREQ